LHPHGIADARILYAGELGIIDLTGVVAAKRLPQRCWP
jgi:flagellar basal body L-ring protein FlgH